MHLDNLEGPTLSCHCPLRLSWSPVWVVSFEPFSVKRYKTIDFGLFFHKKGCETVSSDFLFGNTENRGYRIACFSVDAAIEIRVKTFGGPPSKSLCVCQW